VKDLQVSRPPPIARAIDIKRLIEQRITQSNKASGLGSTPKSLSHRARIPSRNKQNILLAKTTLSFMKRSRKSEILDQEEER